MIRRLSPQAGRKLREASRDISGVNETVASGLSVPLSRPWLLIVPILLDMFLWIGVQIPITRITNPLATMMIEEGGANGELAADQLTLIGESARLNDVIGSMLPSVFAGLSRDNLFSLMAATFAPRLASGIDRDDLADRWGSLIGDAVDPGSAGSIIGLGFLFLLVSSLLTVGWRVPLALSIIHRRMSPRSVVLYTLRAWIRFLALLSLIIGAAMVLLVPLVIVAGILLLAGLDLAALVSVFIVMAGSLAALYTRFVLESIVLNDIGPLRALKRSALIAQTFFGPTLRFSLVGVIVGSGALRLWDVMIFSPPGLPVAIIANSFLGTGMAIATMMFYYDRDQLIQKFSPNAGSAEPHRAPL